MLILSQAREGKLHDKRFHSEEDIAGSVPDAIPVEVDLGFHTVSASQTPTIFSLPPPVKVSMLMN